VAQIWDTSQRVLIVFITETDVTPTLVLIHIVEAGAFSAVGAFEFAFVDVDANAVFEDETVSAIAVVSADGVNACVPVA